MNEISATEQKIVDAWEALQQAKESAKAAKKEASDVYERSYAGLKEACETTVALDDERGLMDKLRCIESIWQDLTEAEAHKKLISSECSDMLKAAEKTLKDSIEDSKQLLLFENFENHSHKFQAITEGNEECE